MAEKGTHEFEDDDSLEADEPDWHVRGHEHPLEGGQTRAINDHLDEDDSLADGSSYRKEAGGLGELIDDGSNYREIAKSTTKGPAREQRP
jgi:hypothetical protein